MMTSGNGVGNSIVSPKSKISMNTQSNFGLTPKGTQIETGVAASGGGAGGFSQRMRDKTY